MGPSPSPFLGWDGVPGGPKDPRMAWWRMEGGAAATGGKSQVHPPRFPTCVRVAGGRLST